MNDVRLQAMLGNLESAGRPDLNMNGYACLARIIKIHHKRNTADVRLVRTNDVIMSVPQNEGKFSCKIGTSYAHFDPDTKKSSGVIEPLQEGQLVIVGYLENLKNEPWILSALHWTMDSKENILPDRYPIESSDIKEYAKYLRVFPSQDYFKVDGDGNIEFALHGKSFFKIDDDLTDVRDGTDFEDLSEKDKFTENTRTMEDSKYHTPKNMLFVHRDNWNDSSSKRTKVFINKEGLLRISRDNNDNKLTFSELHNDGTIRVKRQLDSDVFDGGEYTTEFKISETGALDMIKKMAGITVSISLNENNEVIVRRTSNSTVSEFNINSANDINAFVNAGGEMASIRCSSGGTVNIYGKNGVTISSDSDSLTI